MQFLAVLVAATSGNQIDQIDPNRSPFPGALQLKQLIDGLGFWALLAALVGMLVGAVLWAIGHHSSNYQQAYSGRKGVLVSGAAAMVIGAAPALIRFLFSLGNQVQFK